MTPGISFEELYSATFLYARLSIKIEETKWWEFSKRKVLKEERWYWYPIMKNELTNLK